MREITIRIELYEDIPTSDFEQLLLDEGIGELDCAYEIIED